MNTENIEKTLLKLKDITPNPVWKSGLRAIVTSRFIPSTSKYPRFSWSLKISSAVAFVFMIFFGTAFLSENSLPGDNLYPLKKGYEDLQLKTSDTKSKVSLQQAFTTKRIEELKKVAQNKNSEVKAAIAEVKDSVAQVKTQISQVAENPQSEVTNTLQALPETIEQNQKDLSSIQPALNETDQKEVISVITSLEELKTSVKKTISKEPLSPSQ